MQNRLFSFVCFVLFFEATSLSPNICNRLPKLKDFKSKVIFRYNEREYHIEEYRLGNRGRLIVSDHNANVKDIYYINNDDNIQNSKEVRIAFYNRKSNDCITYQIKDRSEIEPPYKFFDLKSGIYGPTALYAAVQDQLDKFKYEEGITDDRGIDSHICRAANLELPNLSHTLFRLHISDSSWTLFDQKSNDQPQLLKFNIISTDAIDPSDPAIAFGVEIEYLTFTSINQTDSNNLKMHNLDFELDENLWIVPSRCIKFNQIKPKIQIPKKLKVILDKIDNENVPTRFNVIYDRENDFYQFKMIEKNSNDQMSKLIKLGSNFYMETKNDVECFYFNDAKFSSENLRLNQIFVYLYGLEDEYYEYVGQETIRNILTDVYKTYSVVKNDERSVFTIHIQQKLTTNDTKRSFQSDTPIQFKIERFIENNLKETIIYNFYDFEAIGSDEQYASGFDISECSSPNSKVLFNLIAKNELIDDKIQTKQVELDFEKKLRKILEQAINEKPVNFPKVEVKISNDEIMSTIEYSDYSSPLVYFFEPNISFLDEKKNEKDKVFKNKETIETCAIESLNDVESIGFQYCDFKNEQYCHVLTAINLKSGKLIKRKSNEECKLKRKYQNKQILFESTNDKLEKISEASKTNQLVIEYLDQKFIFNKIHFVQDESFIDRSKLFELTSKGRRYTNDFSKKSIILDEGIQNSPLNCYEHCMNVSNNFTCDTFSYCKRDLNYECNLNSLLDDLASHEYVEAKVSIEDSQCDLYSVSILKHFQEHSKRKLNKKAAIVKQLNIVHEYSASSDCALHCLNHNKMTKNEQDHCLSTEVCKNNDIVTCKLSQNHTLWTNEQIVEEDLNCIVYSVRHLLNFHRTTSSKLDDFISESVYSEDHCATRCDISGDCHIFNFCKTESGKFQCHYIRNSVKGDGVIELESDLLDCVTYIHRSHLIGAPQLDKAKVHIETVDKNTGIGFTIGGLSGFIFASIFIGFIIGSDIVYIYKTKYAKGNGRSDSTLQFSNSLTEDAMQNDNL